ncbi:hypothetical protein COO91_09675 (plasmid) [Nostoc flagelliforme CCNUN1]|uniref:Uncharacterized protein n=1 Tax=Nostoc flagelliforme CCNUN1 TaxID=2038116 RepID=A0A2K8T727_9NOSO|nr:hypothetical protein COO91_09675 [Nostoc flagelliforme CCNUN1]
MIWQSKSLLTLLSLSLAYPGEFYAKVNYFYKTLHNEMLNVTTEKSG